MAIYDITANENAGVPSQTMTLKLFNKAKDKTEIVERIQLDESKALESMKNFLRKHSTEYRLAFPMEEVQDEDSIYPIE